jgi:hypothetical protein
MYRITSATPLALTVEGEMISAWGGNHGFKLKNQKLEEEQ